MGDKDLENIISGIGQDEVVAAQKQAQIDRMKQLVKKQKNEMGEQQKIIDDLRSRIDNMYDLPADVEQLKRMIGEMRAEINGKDSQIEIANGNAAQYQAELNSLKTQFLPLNSQLQTYINQVGELRAKLVEIDSLSKLKDQKIQDLQLNIDAKDENTQNMEIEFAKRVQERLGQFMTTEDEYKERISQMEAQLQSKNEETKNVQKDTFNQVSELREELNNKNMKISDFENRIAFLMKSQEDLLIQKTEISNRANELEAKLMEQNLSVQDAADNKESAMKQLAKYQELYKTLETKHQELRTDYSKAKDEIEFANAKLGPYKEFKENNENSVINLEGLMKLFEEEPLFKIFLMIKDVGSMKADFLQKSLGLPTMTTQKYIQKFKNVDLLEETSDGRLTLKFPMKKTN